MNDVGILDIIEAHAALVQALGAIISSMIAACTLAYTLLTLKAVQRQTEASIATTVETFRPIIEVVGGALNSVQSELTVQNKGSGAALNLRWSLDVEPRRWTAYGNLLPAGEQRALRVAGDPRIAGLVLSYQSVANAGELLTFAKFAKVTGEPWNDHVFSSAVSKTRPGWTTASPELAVPAWHPELIAAMPLRRRFHHWWRLKRGLERRL